MELTSILLCTVVLLCWLVHRKLSKLALFFEERGVRSEKPTFIFGNILPSLAGRESFFTLLDRLYEKFQNEKIFGFFNTMVPTFVIKDPALIKQITIKDFDSFVNHDKLFDENVDSLFGRSLFQMFDEKWRIMRNTLSPLFTSSKMKMMFEMVSECSQDFVSHFEKKAKDGPVIIDARDAFARYTVDGISTAAFGFKGDCIENEDSELLKMAQSVIKPSFKSTMKALLVTLSKKTYVLLQLQFFSNDIRDFLKSAIVDVMREREAKNISRPDIIQLLIQAKKGKIEGRDKDDGKGLNNFSANIEYDVGVKDRKKIEWTDEDFMAQGFILFLAGFETTKNLLQTTTFELAVKPHIQEELREEVDEVLATLNGKPVTYDALHKMKFLDQVVSESLRFWNPVVITSRECNKDCKLDLGDGKSILIKKGEQVMIPISAIQRDPNYFETPNVYDPHRFDDDKKDSIVPGSYIPFGYGPRVCIGSRFALMEVKLIIFNILSKFTIEVCDKTPKELVFVTTFSAYDFKERIFVELKPRK